MIELLLACYHNRIIFENLICYLQLWKRYLQPLLFVILTDLTKQIKNGKPGKPVTIGLNAYIKK